MAFSQAANVGSEPENNYILQITRQWSKLTNLKDLRMKKFGNDDIEIRLWVGFELGSTTGRSLRRINGHWKLDQINIKDYQIAASDSLAKTKNILPPDILGKMGGRCTIGTVRHMGSGKLAGAIIGTSYNLDCPQIYDCPNPDIKQTNKLWKDLKEKGILKLPPEDDFVVIDGTTYLLEIRYGQNYRASIFHYLPGADRKISKKYQSILDLLASPMRIWSVSSKEN